MIFTKLTLWGLALLFLFARDVALAGESQKDIIVTLISNVAQRIGGEKEIGVNVSVNWDQSPEVKELAELAPDRRIGALMATIDYLDKSEGKIFPGNKTNKSQLAISVITRIRSLNHLGALISTSENDIVIADYVSGEVADLRLVLAGKINYGIYLQARALRDSKRAMLLYTNYTIMEESMKHHAEEESPAHRLANKTTLSSLMETCVESPELCVSAQAANFP